MSARSTILSLWTAGVCFSGCAGSSTGPRINDENSRLDQNPPIQTDQQVYTATRGTTHFEDGRVRGRFVKLSIGLRYTNSTRDPIYLPTCMGVNPPVLEKKEESGWVTAFAPIVPACLGPPEVIHRGKSFEYTYEVEGYLPGGRVMPQFETEVAGTYRLVWTAYATWATDGPGLGRELPLADRVSNEFEVIE